MNLTPSLPTGRVTLLFSDVEGSTLLLHALKDKYASVIARQREIIVTAAAERGGQVVDAHGDEVFAVFGDAHNGVEAAVAGQGALAAEAWPEGIEVRVRMGIHTGTPELYDDRYVGIDVHRAARIMAAGSGGQVLLSKETKEEVESRNVPLVVAIRDLGWHHLKDLRYPEWIFDVAGADVARTPPTLASLGQRPNNLQELPTELLGRDDEVSELLALLNRDDVQLLTLTGPGGAGKTRLAQELAARLLGSFRDGVFHIGLSAIRDPALVAPTIAQALRVPEFPGLSVLETLKNRLVNSQMLLVLDNLEQVVEAAAVVSQLLAHCAGIKVVVTSREALHTRSERVWPVPPLRVPDPTGMSLEDLERCGSVSLFLDRARRVRPDFKLSAANAEAVASICARLDGLPLALELAASRLVVLTPEALLDRLVRSVDVLKGGARDLDERHRTMRDTIGWSYDLLPDPERDLFERVSVFSGGFPIDAADSVCGSIEGFDEDLLEGLQALAARSLLVPETVSGQPRLRMLSTVRDYAQDRLKVRPGAGECRQRHASYFVALVQDLSPRLQGPAQRGAVNRILDDMDNLRAALDWGLEQPSAAITASLMKGLVWLWVPQGRFTEGLSWAQRAVEHAESTGEERPRAEIHDAAGWLHLFAGDYAAALPHCRTSLQLFEKLESPSDVARTKMTLGITGAVTGELEEGPELIMHALSMYQEQEDPLGIAMALIALGEGGRAGGDMAAAQECFEGALELMRELGNVYWVCHMLQNLAHFRLHDGAWREARDMVGESLDLAREYNFPMIVNLCVAAVGGVAVACGDGVTAARLFGATDKFLSELGAAFEPTDLAELERNMASAKELLGGQRFDSAFREGRAWALEDALAAAAAVGSPA